MSTSEENRTQNTSKEGTVNQEKPENLESIRLSSSAHLPQSRTYSWLVVPINASSLALFRIAFGLIYLRYLYTLYATGWLQSNFAPGVYHFRWPFFEWLPQLSVSTAYLLWAAAVMGVALFVVGLFYRVATAIALTASLYFFLIDQAAYTEKNYFFLCMLFLFLCTDANANFSLDNCLVYKIREPTVPNWQLLAFLFQVSIVNFYSGLAKAMTNDWVYRNEPLLTWLFLGSPNHPVISFPTIASFAEDETMKKLSSWIGYFQILSEMFGAVWPWFGRYFPPVRFLSLGALILNHLFTLVSFGLADPYFWIRIISCVLWINPIFSEGLLNIVLMTHIFDFKYNEDQVNNNRRLLLIFKRFLVWMMLVFLVLQLVLPLRPYWRVWQYDSPQFDPNWTKEGYYLSWRERLFDEDTLVRWEAYELGNRYSIPALGSDFSPYVTPAQREVLKNDPNLIIHFAQFVLPVAIQEKNIFPENVTVDCWRSLNGRPYQRWINNSVNLLEYNEKSYLPLILPQIRDFETEAFFQEMRTVRDKWLQRKYESVFFAERPGSLFQAKFHEFTFTLMLINVKGEIEVEVTDPNNPVIEPDVEILKAGDRLEIPFRAWHTIRVVGKKPAFWAYLYSFPSSVPFHLAIGM